ncbi:MAG TPA: hypothetical protein EYP85_12095 [Armatimonadetes bacterium]|nr:hypothetical protein [Armatimonadota bacterium]
MKGLLLWLSLGGALSALPNVRSVPWGGGAVVFDCQREYDYFLNSWGLIGLKDYPEGTRISPQGELWLKGKRRLQLTFTERHRLLPRGLRKTLLRGYLPIVRYDFRLAEGLRYTLTLFAAPLSGEEQDYAWPRRTENFVDFLGFQVTNEGPQPQEAVWGLSFTAGARGGQVVLKAAAGEPRAIVSADRGEVWAWVETSGRGKVEAEGNRIVCRLRLEAGQSRRVTCKVPFAPLAGEDLLLLRERCGNYEQALARTVEFWEGLLARGARFDLPEPKAAQTFKASLIYNFIGRDRGVVKAGEGFYDALFLRDGAYQVYALEVAGFLPEARESLEAFLRAQKENGQFETQKGQLDAHGYALWALWQYYDLSRDEDWLRRVYSAIRRGVVWLKRARGAEKEPTSPFYGLLPAAVADGENLWDGKHHIVGYDFWNLRGLACAVKAARALNQAGEAADWEREYADYFQCVEAAWARTGLPFFPPSYEKEGTHWGNLEMLHPTLLFAPHDPRVTATLAEVRRSFVEGTIPWSPEKMRAIHPYMSTFVTNTHLRRGEHTEAVEGFYAYLLHTTATNGFPEGVFYERRLAWGNTIPHLWGAAQYIILLRNMLVREEGEVLHLTSAVPEVWLASGRGLRVVRAPTRFGPVDFALQAGPSHLRLSLSLPRRNPPQRIVWHVPPAFRIVEAEGGGQSLTLQRHQVAFSPDTRHLRLRIRRSLTARRPSFRERTVAYEMELARLLEPVKGLVTLPIEPPLEESAVVFLDLRVVANTDPFTSPFGAPHPGRYLFTGLPTGVQIVGGVPFRILNPADNAGRAFVVLQGANDSAVFPQRVEIPVGCTARRLFLLGNVGGWRPEDPGVDGRGLVAEYLVHYADGSVQRIPLISQVTIDDWAQPPQATQTFVGLRGEPWHLSVLGVELQPKPVRSLVFEDKGTPTAPVLVAVTLQK